MKNHFPVLVSAAALFGGLMGLLSIGGVTAAPIDYAVYINPGGASNAMTCGWHVACAPPFTWGNALDWGNSGGSSITWRSWGFRASGSGPLGTAAVGSNSSSGCYRFSARVNSLNGTLRGEATYTHATTGIAGIQWNVNAGIPIGGAFTSRTGLGNTTSSERSGCLWGDSISIRAAHRPAGSPTPVYIRLPL